MQQQMPNDPVSNVQWVPIERVEANDYNPNVVMRNELALLYLSIREDGYTQPIVTYYDVSKDTYIIVDGYHRYLVMKYHQDIYDAHNGLLPIVVIAKDLAQRMASTIRHNRARGKHQLTGMANIVFALLDAGWSDAEICQRIGLEVDELVRLKYVTGFAKLFEDVEYGRAWETRRMIALRRDYDKHGSG